MDNRPSMEAVPAASTQAIKSGKDPHEFPDSQSQPNVVSSSSFCDNILPPVVFSLLQAGFPPDQCLQFSTFSINTNTSQFRFNLEFKDQRFFLVGRIWYFFEQVDFALYCKLILSKIFSEQERQNHFTQARSQACTFVTKDS